MRFVFIGSGSLAVLTGRMLSERGHAVVLIKRDRSVIDALQEELDLGSVHGDESDLAAFVALGGRNGRSRGICCTQAACAACGREQARSYGGDPSSRILDGPFGFQILALTPAIAAVQQVAVP